MMMFAAITHARAYCLPCLCAVRLYGYGAIRGLPARLGIGGRVRP